MSLNGLSFLAHFHSFYLKMLLCIYHCRERLITVEFRDALEFAHKQLFISEELDNPNMRAESYLNLARSHQRLGGLER